VPQQSYLYSQLLAMPYIQVTYDSEAVIPREPNCSSAEDSRTIAVVISFCPLYPHSVVEFAVTPPPQALRWFFRSTTTIIGQFPEGCSCAVKVTMSAAEIPGIFCCPQVAPAIPTNPRDIACSSYLSPRGCPRNRSRRNEAVGVVERFTQTRCAMPRHTAFEFQLRVSNYVHDWKRPRSRKHIKNYTKTV
jgi:hypothetical protein